MMEIYLHMMNFWFVSPEQCYLERQAEPRGQKKWAFAFAWVRREQGDLGK